MQLLLITLLLQGFNAQPVAMNSNEFGVLAVKQLANDNDSAGSFASFWKQGWAAAEKLWADSADYPIRIDTLLVALYRHNAHFSRTTRFLFQVWSCDTSGKPTSMLASTDTITVQIDTFPAGRWYLIPFDTFNIVIDTSQYYFDVVVAWADTNDSLISVLFDNQDSIPHNINWYYYPNNNRWYEHYDFWQSPTSIGVNMIRAIVSTNMVGAKEHSARVKSPLAIFPNPTRSGAKLSYTLTQKGAVNISLFDICGRLVQTLKQGIQNSGNHTVSIPAELAPGVYFVKLATAGEYHQTKLIVLH